MPNSGKKFNFIQVILVLLVIGSVFVMMDLHARITSLVGQNQQKEIAQTEMMRAKGTEAALLLEVTRVSSDRAVIDWAHEFGHLVRPGEKLIIPIPAGEVTPTPVAEQSMPVVTAERWRVWFALFFSE
jgi:hypothetical protein